MPATSSLAQEVNRFKNDSTAIEIDASVSEIRLILGTSRVLKFDTVVPDMVLENQEVLQATPISGDQILVTGKKLGFSSLTVMDAQGNPQTINVHVMGDVRKLEATLHSIFPDSDVRATALNTSVVLQGTAASANQVPLIVSTAQDFFPTVHNNLKVGDSQLVAIEVKVYEVSRTKLRQAGINWDFAATDIALSSAAGGVGTPNLTFNVMNNGRSLQGFLDLLERNTLAKLLDAPTLVAMNGRPAEFLEGGEIPFEINQGLGNVTIQFRPFGTKLDVVPIVLGNNRVRLEIRAEVSEPATDLTSSNGTPGFRVRRVNTGVEMKIGHTLALAGDYREEVEAETSGIPGLKNMPYIGSAFRRVRETKNELELIIMMTPRYVSETDPSALPPIGMGQLTASPSDCELYWNGNIEVPRCEQDCPGPQGISPARPVQFNNGSTDYTSNDYLNQRPTEMPQVLREYQQNFPGTDVGNYNQSNFGYPEAQGTPAQNSSWPSNGRPVQESNTPPWPSNSAPVPSSSSNWPTRQQPNRVPTTAANQFSSRRNTQR